MIGSPRVHHRSIDSTNRLARELAGAGAEHGTVVTADEQTAGRGRSDRTWTAPAGSSLLMSVVVRPGDPLLPLRAAVALCDALADLDDVAVKWPNDVWVAGKKVAGILVEARPQEGWAVLGMGVNVLSVPPGFEEQAAFVGTMSVAEVFEALCGALEVRIAEPPEHLLEAFRARDGLLGREVAWDRGHGRAAGVDDTGALIVETDGGQITLDAGEVHLR